MAHYRSGTPTTSDPQVRDKDALIMNPILPPSASGELTAVTLMHTLPEPEMFSRLTSAPVLAKPFRAESHDGWWALSANHKHNDCYVASHGIFSQIALYD